MEGLAGAYILVSLALVILFPGLPALAVVLLFVPGCRALARDLALIGVISFVMVILANALNWILLMYVLPPIISIVPDGIGFWFVLLGIGPCLWSALAVFFGALIGSRLGRRLGRVRRPTKSVRIPL
jgi:hypothetical protein